MAENRKKHIQVAHHTLCQVSTATALVEGIYQGAVRVGTLRRHGDLGLGTFEDLDGEMVMVDGHCFQVRSDGSVQECKDDVLSPFAVITRFAPDEVVTLARSRDMGHLTSRFDALRPSDNFFFARRVDGLFDYVYLLNVIPTIPSELTEDWNLVTRTDLPIINQPSLAPGAERAFGLGGGKSEIRDTKVERK